MPVDISRKLCLTAAWLRVDSRKELAAAFRRINSATGFDLQRAHKWLQGRAHPRGGQIYEDWAALLQLGESPEWLAECSAEAFLERLCARHGGDPARLRSRADSFAGVSTLGYLSRDRDLVGTYACYSPAWSAYHRGHVVRSTLTITPATGASKLQASYVENLPMGMLQLSGPLVRGERVVSIHLGTPHTSAQLFLWLFAPAPPTAVLGGLVSGTTLMSAEPQISVCRMIIIRIPGNGWPDAPPAYMAKGTSVAEDLARSGLKIDAPEAVDRAVEAFLDGGSSNFDQITGAALRDVADLCAPYWLNVSRASAPVDRLGRLASAE
jgi:hypothetical protein